jgi:hypothetical protein
MFFAYFLGMSVGNYMENTKSMLVNVDEAIVSPMTPSLDIQSIIPMDMIAILINQELNTYVISNEYAMNSAVESVRLKSRQVEAPSSNTHKAYPDNNWRRPPRSDSKHKLAKQD